MNKGTTLLLQLKFLLLLVLYCTRESPIVPSSCITVDAFSPQVPISTLGTLRLHTRSISTATTTTPLFGLRTKAKEKIASLTRKLRIERRRQSDAIIEKQPDDDDDDDNVLIQRSSPSASSAFTPIVAVETTSPQNDDDSDDEQVHTNNLTKIIVKGRLEESDCTIEEAEQQEEDMEELDLILTLPSKTISLVHLPPLLNQQQKLTRAQQEFRDHFVSFQRYSHRDVALLKSKRLRVVLEGMAATPLEPAVYKSLEILYQDLLPLRLAGRFIFRRLSQVMEMCVQARNDELQHLLQNTTSLSMATLEVAQFAFSEWVTKLCCCEHDNHLITQVDNNGGMDNDREHDLVLPTLRLFQSSSCGSCLLNDPFDIKSGEKENIQHLAALLDPQQSGTITFPQFVHGLQQWCQDNDKTLDNVVLNQITRNILVNVAKKDVDSQFTWRILDPTRQSYSDRFDEMLAAIREWQTLFFNASSLSSNNNNHNNGHNDGDGDDDDSFKTRRWQVLKGCCVGAENEAVREALRICYVDNAASRISGNIIFALVSALIPKQKQK